MNFYQHIPEGELSDHVEVLMHFTDFVPAHKIERVVPTGHIFIIFELDGITRHTYNHETLKPNASFTKVWISGLHRNYLSISAHENSSMFVIQFKNAGAYPFLHSPLSDITEQVVPAEKVLGDDILELRDKILQTKSPEEKFTIAEHWLTKQYDKQLDPTKELLSIIKQLQKEPASSLNEIIDGFPNTQKHLIDLFKKHVGTTPKYFQRILRFNDILQRIQHKEKVAWTDIAYTCGYSDQSHFIKEFKHFSGFNPKEFIEQEHNKQPNFFPIDKRG